MSTPAFNALLSSLCDLLTEGWRTNRSITLLILVSFLSLLVSFAGLGIDHRLIGDEFAWVKPFKFSISLLLYGSSLLVIARYLTQNLKLLKWTSHAALTGCIVELAAIIVQVFRGAPSHFNFSTPLDATLWFLIKAAIMPVAFAIIVMLYMLMKEKSLPPVMGAAIKWGAFLTVVGFIPGFMMLMPDHLQHLFTAHLMAGHNVGVYTNHATLPLIGWNAVSGDLRVAHFVGLHALQAIPIIGFLVQRLQFSISEQRQRILIAIFSISYLSVMAVLTWQALHGESIAMPGLQTVKSYILISASGLLGIVATILPIKYAELLRGTNIEQASATSNL